MLKYDYDSSADVLYAFNDNPQPAKVTDVGNGLLLRTDVETGNLVGFTIIGFKEKGYDSDKIVDPQGSDDNLTLLCMKASEDSLKESWDSEEDKYWDKL